MTMGNSHNTFTLSLAHFAMSILVMFALAGCQEGKIADPGDPTNPVDPNPIGDASIDVSTDTSSDVGTDASGDGAVDSMPDTTDATDPPPGAMLLPPPRLHRLNRLEYNKSVQHLLGTQLSPADSFPPDAASLGLDNIAESLTLTPTLLNAYYSAAVQVIDDALASKPSYLRRLSAEDLPMVGEAVGSLRALNGQALQLSERFPGGPVELVFEAVGIAFGADIAGAPDPLQPRLDVLVDGTRLRTVVVGGSTTSPSRLVFPLDLSAGTHTLRFQQTNFVRNPAAGYGNDVQVASVEIRGPNVAGPGVSRVFVCEPTAPSLGNIEVRRHVRNPTSFAAWSFEGPDIESTATDGWTDGPHLPLSPRVARSPDDPRLFVIDSDSEGDILRHIRNPTSLLAWHLEGVPREEISGSALAGMRIGLQWPQLPRLVRGSTPHVYIIDDARVSAEVDDYDTDCYRNIVHTFARRAWRRELQADEQSELFDFWRELVVAGESPDDAVHLTLRRILVAPDFIYRHRREPADQEWLASRLSYFLWSSVPDEALMNDAASGSLDSDETLRGHVQRMLADERASAIVDGFGEQWLSTRRLSQLEPSPATFPEADAALLMSMEQESKRFFGTFLSSERPVQSMIDADFAMLDDRLASHYESAAPGSGTMQEVAPSEGRPSVLGLSAWLALHVKGDHPSPIQRGRWLSDHVLCDPVLPPPAGLEVPDLDFEDEGAVREQLERHRDDPACSTCHLRLDVLGMGFQRYDAVGRVRDDAALDTTGNLPSTGEAFEGAEEMAAAMDRQAFVACVGKWLYTYALGRAPNRFENAWLQSTAEEASREDWSLPRLLEAIVLSDGFRGREEIGGRP